MALSLKKIIMKNTVLSISILLLSTLMACNAQENDSFVYAENEPLKGQIHTAERLRTYMNAKDYDKAISLFSAAQQENIQEIKKEKETFQYWCLVWTLNEATFNQYISLIKAEQAIFVFENSEWKINER